MANQFEVLITNPKCLDLSVTAQRGTKFTEGSTSCGAELPYGLNPAKPGEGVEFKIVKTGGGPFPPKLFAAVDNSDVKPVRTWLRRFYNDKNKLTEIHVYCFPPKVKRKGKFGPLAEGSSTNVSIGVDQ